MNFVRFSLHSVLSALVFLFLCILCGVSSGLWEVSLALRGHRAVTEKFSGSCWTHQKQPGQSRVDPRTAVPTLWMADESSLNFLFLFFFLAWHSLFPPHWKVLIPPQRDPKLLSAFFSVWDGTCRCPCRCWAGWKGTVAVGHQCHTFQCGSMPLRSLIAHPQMPEFYPKPVLNIPVQCLWNLGPEKEHLLEGTWGAWAPWSCALICGEVEMRNFCFKCHFFGLCLVAPWVFLVPFPKGGSWMQSLVPLLGSSPPWGWLPSQLGSHCFLCFWPFTGIKSRRAHEGENPSFHGNFHQGNTQRKNPSFCLAGVLLFIWRWCKLS